MEGNGWYRGTPPLGSDECSSILDLQLLLAYQTARELEANLGLRELSNAYDSEIQRLKKSIVESYWHAPSQRFSDTSDKNFFSQHANALAILTGIVKNDSAKALMKKILTDTTLTQATIYFQYYVNRALAQCGLGDLYLDQLDIWKENLKLGLTTWAEKSSVDNSRSDCHAWGSSPNVEFFRIVLGIDSDAPGFSRVRIEPYLGKLSQASGTMPHPNGPLHVSYKQVKGKWQADITLPQGVEGILIWKGKSYNIKEGKQVLAL